MPSGIPPWSVTGTLVGISHDWNSSSGGDGHVVTTLTFRVGENFVQVAFNVESFSAEASSFDASLGVDRAQHRDHDRHGAQGEQLPELDAPVDLRQCQ
jgi:hypothetical protein